MLCALAPHLHLSLRVSQPRFLLPAARTASPCALWPTGRRGARAGLGVAIRAGLRRAKQRFYRRSSCLRFLPARAAAFLEAPGRAQRPAGRKRREGCAWWGQKTAPLLLPCTANSLGAPRVPCPKDPSPPSPSPPGSPTHTQAPTCSHFLSPSDLPPSLATSIPAHGADPSPFHLFFHPPIAAKLFLSLFLSPHFPPRHVLLGAQFPCAQLSRFLPPSQKKRKKGHFPASLEPWDVPLPPAAWAHPLLHARSGERGAGTGGAAAGDGTAGCCQVSGATAASTGVPHGVLPTPAHAWWQLPILRRAAPAREGGFWGHVRAEERSGRA